MSVVAEKKTTSTGLKVNVASCKTVKSDSRTNSRSLVSPKQDLAPKSEYIKQLSGKLNLNNEYTPKKYSFDGGEQVKSIILSAKKTSKFTFEQVDEKVEPKEEDNSSTKEEKKVIEENVINNMEGNPIDNNKSDNVISEISETRSSSRCLIF
jgi:hypothetical protein